MGTEIIDRLGRHRCKVINLSYGGIKYKDPNETHLDGINLQNFFETAKTIDPEELKRLTEFHDEIMEELDPEYKEHDGLKLPWVKTFESIRLRRSEVSVWAGINSYGKSILTSHIMVDGVAQGAKFCVASMEMPPRKLGAKIYQLTGAVTRPTKEHAKKIQDLINHSVYIFTAYGTAKSERIMEVFEYARRRYGVSHFIIDSLAKCGFAEDDFKGQKHFVDQLFEYALENKVHVHLVVHMRKGETEEKPPGKFDVKGTGGITDMVSNVFIIWRNKRKERLLRNDKDSDREKRLKKKRIPFSYA